MIGKMWLDPDKITTVAMYYYEEGEAIHDVYCYVGDNYMQHRVFSGSEKGAIEVVNRLVAMNPRLVLAVESA